MATKKKSSYSSKKATPNKKSSYTPKKKKGKGKMGY